MTIEQLEAFSETKPELRYLTEEIIKYLQDNPGGGSPGGGGILSATVELTDAQIKALPTTPVQIVAAPGAGKVIIPFVAYVYFNWVANYDNINFQARIVFGYDASNTISPFVVFDEQNVNSITALLRSGESKFCYISQLSYVDDATNAFPVSSSGVINKNLSLKMTSTDGDLIDGDVANTLKVTVYYIVVDL